MRKNWYVCEEVFDIRIQDDDRHVVHVKTVLLREENAEDALRRAMEDGVAGGNEFVNTDGKNVMTTFVGLRNVLLVHDELEDGAELYYEEHIVTDPLFAQGLVRPRESLSVFRGDSFQWDPSRPNYASAEILTEALQLIERGKAGTEKT
jgi:hypothetical protein